MAELRDKVFVCYAHADDEYLKRLKVHLRPYERDAIISVWSDTDIKTGQTWRKEIEGALDRAAIGVLLVSADFLASDYIANEELPRLLQAAQSEGVRILSIILKPCAFENFSSLAQFQAVNAPSRSLISLNEAEREQLWVDLVGDVQEAMDDFRAKHDATQKIENAIPNPKNTVSWDNVATLFWLANDLMWVQDMMYRMASPERVLQGINHILEYVEQMNFPPAQSPDKDLLVAKSILEPLVGIAPTTEDKKAFLEGHYRSVRVYIETVKWYIARLAESRQPGFKKLKAH